VGVAPEEQTHPARLPRRRDELRAFLRDHLAPESIRLLSVSIKEVLAFRDEMLARELAPKTMNRRIRLSRVFTNISPPPRPNFDYRLRCRILLMLSSSRASPPIPETRPKLFRLRMLCNLSGCRPARHTRLSQPSDSETLSLFRNPASCRLPNQRFRFS
jgi:hypothetical protein